MVEYTGPENERDYLAWLEKEYPQSLEYPPNSLWKMDGQIYQVVGYCEFDEGPGLKITRLPTPAYEDLPNAAQDVHAKCFGEKAVPYRRRTR